MASKTVTVTAQELQGMINAQRKMYEALENNNTDKKAVALGFTSIGTAILGLVFWQSTAVSVAAGVVSVLCNISKQVYGNRRRWETGFTTSEKYNAQL